MTRIPFYPFDHQRLIGTVSEVGPAFVKLNLPLAATADARSFHGNRVASGEVGEFVVVEAGDLAIFGRITLVRLPERERLSVEPQMGRSAETHPVGTVQLLTTIDLPADCVLGGISRYPRLGAPVYSAHPLLIKWLTESGDKQQHEERLRALPIGTIPEANGTPVSLSPESLFGRHCAILGATGGGKSWTLARILEQLETWKSKVILLDATGEFHKLHHQTRHLTIGGLDDAPSAVQTFVPYRRLNESDLFAMFTPSLQSQTPKLRGAMRSLKLASVAPSLASNGLIHKEKRLRQPVDDAYMQHVAVVESLGADFDISLLAQQIDLECVYPADFNEPAKWGKIDETARSYCVSLVMRIESMLAAPELACVFHPGSVSVFDEMDAFFAADGTSVLRISLKSLGFGYSAREIVANAVGRYLLTCARAGKFKQRPLIVMLDEAHQFLNKTVGDEGNRYALDSFELIAKEGRKYSLNICIATQRPRDIPEGVLSQMGTMIVHRLTNDKDREVVERAAGDIDRSAAEFLPTLAPGRAAVIGADFPVPLTIQILPPSSPPESHGPNYQRDWPSLSAAPEPPSVQAVSIGENESGLTVPTTPAADLLLHSRSLDP
jgi:DNA helicase HerA-like ATPase